MQQAQCTLDVSIGSAPDVEHHRPVQQTLDFDRVANQCRQRDRPLRPAGLDHATPVLERRLCRGAEVEQILGRIRPGGDRAEAAVLARTQQDQPAFDQPDLRAQDGQPAGTELG